MKHEQLRRCVVSYKFVKISMRLNTNRDHRTRLAEVDTGAIAEVEATAVEGQVTTVEGNRPTFRPTFDASLGLQ